VSEDGFASIILDVDSTLCGVEGIDWLAAARGADVSERVEELTRRAMAGEVALDSVYGERLALVAPSWESVAALADVYVAALAPGAGETVREIMASGRSVVLVSGGILEAIGRVAVQLGIPQRHVHAVSLRFDTKGNYRGYDTTSPLATSTGKRVVAETLHLRRRVLAVGDGVTDLAMRPAVDSFAAYTGFIRRASVADVADVEIEDYRQLGELVLT